MATTELTELTQKQVTSNVANRIEAMKSEGLLIAPNYSVSNALSSAYYALKNSNSGNLLEKCTHESIYNALLDMVTQGLSPAKTQCYFIPYGNSVKLNRSYFGTMKVVKQLSEVKDIYVKVIYEGDDFQAENTETGWKFVKHDSNWKNQDNPIEGAYCIIKKNDGEEVMTIMTKKEIDKSWGQSRNGSVQKNFPQEMAKRTVINRAAKQFFNTSDDNDLFVDAVNRTTENEYDNDRQVKDVTPQETNSLDDLIGHQNENKDAPSDLKDASEYLHSEPEKTLTDENKTVLEDTSYPADEVPDFDQETGEVLASEGNLFDNLGDLMP
ncbi:Recombinational DNA repair protein RecT (prophage associated) [Streptococcus pyogenes]|uniref:recombinase RecT n=1 Tax=Streptococcus pyogenes TaxID=1314 RepID=UPI00109D4FA6|nr:RecT family recombinase [Streptococcus pyogenes]VHA85050.1 Recombinational DNA repair protein RecT (prophage associated) [Streptococcus pyogenes]VHB21267.1 Recombinational DNA repair protein RecT (prophage associated) [Streptococcus pyogenes]VHC71603.1 Recombinational DNA repair protein RecT (prophage associated) [Streptococcus pyogenes]VHD20137.1 Recombinational DNA repair protein RecT (prophage associated) [Streptococcus pyogenes]VHD27929.1 Recombinational DNA repair protein RecT (prophag